MQTMSPPSLVLPNEKDTFQDLEPTMNQAEEVFVGFKRADGATSAGPSEAEMQAATLAQQ